MKINPQEKFENQDQDSSRPKSRMDTVYEDIENKGSNTCDNCPDSPSQDSFNSRKQPSRYNIYKNLGPVITLIIANALYIDTNVKCPFPGDGDCMVDFVLPNVFKWLGEIILSALLFSVVVIWAINRKISRKYAIVAILNILFLSCIYKQSQEHGSYGSALGFYLLLTSSLIFFIYLVKRAIGILYNSNPSLTIIVVPIIFIMIFGTAYHFRIAKSCDNWTKGLDGEEMSYEQPYCKMRKPEVCWYDVVDGLMDFTFWFRIKCEDISPHPYISEPYYKDHKLIAFPRSEHFPFELRLHNVLQSTLLNNMVPLSGFDDPKAKDLEVFIDRSNPKNYKMTIDVKRNETLVQERAKIKHDHISKNLLFLYIDTLSRARFIKNFPKTAAWFEQFMNQKHPDMETFQFFKYHSITPYTQGNLYAALYGIPYEPQDYKTYQEHLSVIKQFKEKGYITGHATDYCDISFASIDEETKNWVQDVPFDHEGITFNCDPEYHDPIDYSYFRKNGPFSMARRCLYKKDVFEYTLDYGNQFWRKYKNEKKALFMEFITNHESTQEVAKFLDAPLANYLSNLQKDGMLEDTTILLYSDHGLHCGFSIFDLTDIRSIERVLPTLFIVLPKHFTSKYRVTLKENQQKLVSATQIHETFLTLIEGEKSSHLNSSIIGNLKSDLTCDDIGIYNTNCKCVYE